jgi:hypothetical protein
LRSGTVELRAGLPSVGRTRERAYPIRPPLLAGAGLTRVGVGNLA